MRTSPTAISILLGIAFALTNLHWAAAPSAAAAQIEGETPLFLGNKYYWQGLYEDAIEHYLQADGGDWAAGIIGASRTWALQGEYEKAIEVCREAIRDPQQDPYIATQLAEVLAVIGQVDKAITILQEVVEIATPPIRSLVQYGKLLDLKGRRDSADGVFQIAVDRHAEGLRLDSEEIAMVAVANWQLERFHDANRLFRTAIRSDPTNLEAQVLWGDLYLEKYNRAEALKSYQQVLDQNRWYVDALVGAAKASVDTSSYQYLSEALGTNPASPKALIVLAKLALANSEFTLAASYIERVLAINATSLSAQTLMAAMAALKDDQNTFDRLAERVAAQSPGNGRFYADVADVYAQNYRFSEAAALAKRAVNTDPRYWPGYTILGMNLIRLGREEEGRTHLEYSFDKDPFNIWTSNMLKVFDTLETFVTRRSDHFVVRMPARDATVLWPYLETLLEESWQTLSSKYRFEPAAPVLIELFENKNDFAVRSLGLPDIGPLVGICFGRVITLVSPDTLGANWQEVVWHEFAHVITLQMTGNRMPRWLSEGISVYEGNEGRPEWGRRQDLDLVKAVRLEKMLPIAQLNDGFAKAESVDDLQFAYFQSYLVVQHIVDEYGFDHLRSLVEQYADIKPIEEMFAAVFEQDLASFESGFYAWLDRKVSAVDAYVHLADPMDQGEAHGHGMPRNPSVMLAEIYSRAAIIERMEYRIAEQPKDFQAHLQLGVILLQDNQYDQAMQHLKIAKQLVPKYGGFPSPQQVLSELYEKLGDEDAMLQELQSLISFQQHDFNGLMKLAENAWETGDLANCEYYLYRAIAVDPYSVDIHRLLADLSKRKLDYVSAVREYRILLELDVTDPVATHTNLAEVLFQNGDIKEAKRNIVIALEIAPTYERAQSILLDIVDS